MSIIGSKTLSEEAFLTSSKFNECFDKNSHYESTPRPQPVGRPSSLMPMLYEGLCGESRREYQDANRIYLDVT